LQLINFSLLLHLRDDPSRDAKVEYEFFGFALAHEKAAELRMAGFKNVVMTLEDAPDSGE
jgi:hypothetical protein